VETAPLAFDDSLAESLSGADTLYNTYWVRFERGETTFDRAVRNTERLFTAAKAAGVRRIVHVSVANPDASSPFPYFRGKAQTEAALRRSGLSHAIVRPTLVYGPEDILVNNIAWAVRHIPLFLVPRGGSYEVQPVSVWDTARICVDAGAREGDVALDAAGPGRWEFVDFVRLIARTVGGRAWVRSSPRLVAIAMGRMAGLGLRDVVVTADEADALAAGLLVSRQPSLGRDRFEVWLADNGEVLGRTYASELGRNFRDHVPT
jgi:NADH dehydrogenase